MPHVSTVAPSCFLARKAQGSATLDGGGEAVGTPEWSADECGVRTGGLTDDWRKVRKIESISSTRNQALFGNFFCQKFFCFVSDYTIDLARRGGRETAKSEEKRIPISLTYISPPIKSDSLQRKTSSVIQAGAEQSKVREGS